MNLGKNYSPGTQYNRSNAMDKVSASILTSGTTYYTTNAIRGGLMPTLEETISNGRESWEVVVLPGCWPTEAIDHKQQLVEAGLVMGQDFFWEYRASEYDGFTMNRDRHAVFAFRDAAVASFYRLKWL
jgi:hypothetical protein